MARPVHRRTVSFAQKAYSFDPHECIELIGGINSDKSRWKLSQQAAINAIESGTDEFFVVTKDRTVKVAVVTLAGQKYLRASAGDKAADSLLTLPSS
jgi:hypothetical protein